MVRAPDGSGKLELVDVRGNSQYEFTSEQAQSAYQKYGVKSISLVARKR